jgi:hypothetical protein
MTKHNEQEVARPEPRVPQATATDQDAGVLTVPELKAEELEERIAPASLSDFHFTSSTVKSSP